MINIALLGFGTVGSGVAEVIDQNRKLIETRLGEEINVKYILDLRDFPDSPYADRIVHDISAILGDADVSIVAEMMGGVHPAADFTRACLEAGKSVVTSNKAVVAAVGDELLGIARQNGVRYLFEASVGGGIPVLRPLIDDLADNEIRSVAGILNGTTNFILTEMKNNGTPFETVLSRAQRLGYAEADPSADVDGFDAARKIIILAAIAYGKLLPLEAVSVEGIRNIPAEDVSLLATAGISVKLIAYAEKTKDGKIYAAVSPRAVLPACPLCHVDDVFNGVLIDCNMLGETMFYGRGAGKLPTASAVVADIIDAAERPNAEPARLMWSAAGADDVAAPASHACRRCFILNGEPSEIPAAFTEAGTLTVEGEGGSAFITAKALTDDETLKAIKTLGAACRRSYKVI